MQLDPHPDVSNYRAQWEASPSLPLTVARAGYEVPAPQEWEVMFYEHPAVLVPIASFTSWIEAQRWAVDQAMWALAQGVHPGDTRGAIEAHWRAQQDAENAT